MRKTKKAIGSKIKIIGATMITIFSLLSAFTATFAWFASNLRYSMDSSSFAVVAPDGVQFDLYYLHHFAVDESTNKDGNYNYGTDLLAGYEIAYANPVFELINYDSEGLVTDDPDPTNISHLWPAHKATYAIVITSGEISSFSLESWAEVRSPTALTQVNAEDVEISLSWAIDLFGGAYYVTNTGDVIDDLATGFTSYSSDNTVTDKFLYSQTNIAPVEKPSINVVSRVSGVSGDNKRIILYFSIEFSDDSNTYYVYNDPYYEKSVSGNSNCYEKLSLRDLVFKLG